MDGHERAQEGWNGRLAADWQQYRCTRGLYGHTAICLEGLLLRLAAQRLLRSSCMCVHTPSTSWCKRACTGRWPGGLLNDCKPALPTLVPDVGPLTVFTPLCLHLLVSIERTTPIAMRRAPSPLFPSGTRGSSGLSWGASEGCVAIHLLSKSQETQSPLWRKEISFLGMLAFLWRPFW